MHAWFRWTLSVASLSLLACAPRTRECAVGAERAELELVATRRFSAQLERSHPLARTDSVVMILVLDSIARDTAFGHATGPLSALGVDVGPDTLGTRPYYAHCRGDSSFVTLDPRIVDKELWARGGRALPVHGAWSTAGFPQVEGEFRFRPSP